MDCLWRCHLDSLEPPAKHHHQQPGCFSSRARSLARIGTITEQQNWRDTWASAIGVAYRVNKEWVLRSGLSVDQSPTNNTDRSVRIPTGDRKAISFGAGWSPTDDLTIDLAVSYLKEKDVDVNLSNPQKGTYSAEYENSAWGYGLGATYKF